MSYQQAQVASCACTLPEGWTSVGGWHMRPSQPRRTTRGEVIASTVGLMEAYDRCPPYWRARGYEVFADERDASRMVKVRRFASRTESKMWGES